MTAPNNRAEIIALIRAYAVENMRMATDTILHDPVLHPRGRVLTPEMEAQSEALQIDGTVYSAKYHAAMDILALMGESIP